MPFIYMVLDIETTHSQEIIQVAYKLYDETHDFLKSYNSLINENIGKTDYYQRFTLDEIAQQGKSPEVVLKNFYDDFKLCKYVVGHNISFDVRHMLRYLEKYNFTIEHVPEQICTMHLSTNVCNIVGKNNKVKWPKLSELYKFCFEEEPDETMTHQADYDVDITFMCFYYLMVNNLIELKF